MDRSSAEPRDRRGISPVIGVILMLAIVVVLGGVAAAGFTTYTEELEEPDIDGLGATETPATGADEDMSTEEPTTEEDGGGSSILSLSDATAGATGVTHTATYTAESGDDAVGSSLNGIKVVYDAGATDVSDVDQSDVVAAGIDEDGDGDTETDILDDLSSADTDTTQATFAFGGNYNVGAGDTFVVEFASVDNGDAGDHGVTVRINPQSANEARSGTVTLTES